eukprot:gene15518-6781_t
MGCAHFKAEKTHLPCEISSLLIEHSYRISKSSSHATARKEYEPRSRADLSVVFGDADWEGVAEATDRTASVLQFKKNKRGQMSPHDLEKISYLTIGQSSSEDWKNYRLGLITASVVHEVLKKVDNELQISNFPSAYDLCAKICGYYPDFSSKSVSWGKNNEDFARKRYIKKNKGKHKSFSCTTSDSPEKPTDQDSREFLKTILSTSSLPDRLWNTALEVGAALFTTAIQYKVAQTLISNPPDYANKMTFYPNPEPTFKSSKSLLDLLLDVN